MMRYHTGDDGGAKRDEITTLTSHQSGILHFICKETVIFSSKISIKFNASR